MKKKLLQFFLVFSFCFLLRAGTSPAFPRLEAGDQWHLQTGTVHQQGLPALQSNQILDHETAALTCRITGPGNIFFYWKVSSEQEKDRLRILIDGQLLKEISGEVDWEPEHFPLTGDGEHVIRWEYIKNSSRSEGQDCGWISGFTVTAPWQSPDSGIRQSTDIQDGGTAAEYKTVIGPGTLVFQWKVSSEEKNDQLEIEIDGVPMAQISGQQDWQEKRYEIAGSGRHVICWKYSKNSSVSHGSDCGWLRGISWESSSQGWFSQDGTAHNGGPAWQSEGLGDNGIASRQEIFNGPGTLSFFWKVSSEKDHDLLGFFIDDQLRDQISGNVDWQRKVFRLPGHRPYVIRWEYAKNGSGYGGSDCGWLDDILFTADRTQWHEQHRIVCPAGDTDGTAWQSNTISAGETAVMQQVVDGPGVFTFQWKVSSTSDSDWLKVFIDDRQQDQISGEVNWQEKRYEIPGNGQHVIRWEYVKNGEYPYGSDCGWVDNTQWISSRKSWHRRSIAGGPDGSTAWQSDPIGDNETASMQQSFRGPAEISFHWQASSERNDRLKFFIDNQEQNFPVYGAPRWEERRYRISAGGMHTVRWDYSKDNGSSGGDDCGRVCGIRITSNDLWFESPDAGGLWQSSDPGDLQSAVLTRYINGPARLSFAWKVSSEKGCDRLQLVVDGKLQEEISGEQDWRQKQLELSGDTVHTVQWIYVKDGNGRAGQDCGWVKSIHCLKDWHEQTAVYQNGDRRAWQSNRIDKDEIAVLQQNFNGPGQLSFTWKVSSENRNGVLRLFIDDYLKEEISGEQNWQKKTYQVNGYRKHIVRWEYSKTENSSGGSDCGWVDEISWISPWLLLPSGEWQSYLFSHGESAVMERVISGEGTFLFDWKMSSESSGDKLKFYLDGELKKEISGIQNWQTVSWAITGNRDHVIRWEYVKNSNSSAGSDRGWIRNPFFCQFTCNTDWFLQSGISHSGGRAWQSNNINDGGRTSMEKIFQGAGTLSFYWKVSSESGYDKLKVFIDNQCRGEISGNQDWKQWKYSVWGDGRHIIRWEYSKNGSGSEGSDCGWVDEITFARGWHIQNSTVHSGGSAWQSDDINDSQSVSLEKKIFGEGELSFYWKVSSESGYDKLKVFIDNQCKAEISGNRDWELKNYTLTGPGEHTIRWEYSKDGSSSIGSDCGWVDDIVWNSSPLPLPRWRIQSGVTHNGFPVWRSDPILHNEKVSLSYPLSGSGQFSFYWKVSSQSGDKLKVFIDNQYQGEISGNQDWTQQTYSVQGGGNHTIRWEYSKDGSGSEGSDCGWLSDFTWIPPVREWRLQSEVTCNGEDTWRNEAIGDNEVVSMHRSFNGPGTLSFSWKTSSEAGCDKLRLFIDNEFKEEISGMTDWRKLVFPVTGEGLHIIHWEYAKDGSGSEGSDCGWIGGITYDRGWLPQQETGQNGLPVQRNEAIQDNAKAIMEQTVFGLGTLSFDWKVSSELGGDFLQFHIDDELQNEISGDMDWQTKQYRLTSRQTHRFRWIYRKNSSGSAGEDCGWIRNLRWELDDQLFRLTVLQGSGTGEYRTGTEVTVSAQIPENHTFVRWESEGMTLSDEQKTANPLTLIMPPADLSLTAVTQKNPPDTDAWQPPKNMANSMTCDAVVRKADGLFIKHPESILAFFNAAGQCRGTARPRKTSWGDLVFSMQIWSDRPREEGYTAQVLDYEEQQILPIRGTFTFIQDSRLGNAEEPAVLMAGLNTLHWELQQGWNWVSANVNDSFANLTDLLKNYEPADGDQIKSQHGYSTYYADRKLWDPMLQFIPGRMYAIRRQSPVTALIRVTGTPLPAAQRLRLQSGWNWIGCFTDAESLSIDQLTSSAGFAMGDQLKGQLNEYTTYYVQDRQTGWDGTLTEMQAGRGYKIHIAENSMLGVAGQPEAQPENPAPLRTRTRSGRTCPWTVPTGFANSMTLDAMVQNGRREPLTQTGSAIGIFDEQGSCRGIALLRTTGWGTPVYSGQIWSNSGREEDFELKFWDASTGQITGIRQSLDFIADTACGNAMNPMIFILADSPAFSVTVNKTVHTGYQGDRMVFYAPQSPSGYQFQTWEADGVRLSGSPFSPVAVFTMPGNDVTLTSRFSPLSFDVPEGWRPISPTPQTMTVIGCVELPGGMKVNLPETLVAVFDSSGSCRSVSAPVPALGEGLNYSVYYLQIADGVEKQGLRLVFWNRLTGEELEIEQTLDFVPGAVQGTDTPIVWHTRYRLNDAGNPESPCYNPQIYGSDPDRTQASVILTLTWLNSYIGYDYKLRLHPDARTAPEDAYDIAMPSVLPPGGNTEYAYLFTDDRHHLQIDSRPMEFQHAFWKMKILVPAEKPATLDWMIPLLPENCSLSLKILNSRGAAVTETDMLTADSCTISEPGEYQAVFTMTDHTLRTFSYSLKAGWNCITPALALNPESVQKIQSLSPMLLDTDKMCHLRPADADIVPGACLMIYCSADQTLTISGNDIWLPTPELLEKCQCIRAVHEIRAEQLSPNIRMIRQWTDGDYHLIQDGVLKAGYCYWIMTE